MVETTQERNFYKDQKVCNNLHPKNYTSMLGMSDYENMSQQLLSVQVSRLLRLLATLHTCMYVDFIQQSN